MKFTCYIFSIPPGVLCKLNPFSVAFGAAELPLFHISQVPVSVSNVYECQQIPEIPSKL